MKTLLFFGKQEMPNLEEVKNDFESRKVYEAVYVDAVSEKLFVAPLENVTPEKAISVLDEKEYQAHSLLREYPGNVLTTSISAEMVLGDANEDITTWTKKWQDQVGIPAYLYKDGESLFAIAITRNNGDDQSSQYKEWEQDVYNAAEKFFTDVHFMNAE